MATIELTTLIAAPRERCFDLARSIDLHLASTASTGEKAVRGTTSGLIGLNEEVTWRARHFGVWQHFTSRITAFEPPEYFRDTMTSGAFASFQHDHFFTAMEGNRTAMRDVLVFRAPLGLLGRMVERLVLTRYLERFLRARNAVIKQAAESPAASAT